MPIGVQHATAIAIYERRTYFPVMGASTGAYTGVDPNPGCVSEKFAPDCTR